MNRVWTRGLPARECSQAEPGLGMEGRGTARAPGVPSFAGEAASPAPASLAPQAAAPVAAAPAVVEEPEAGLHIITSPIVGTFYRSPNPEAPNFVQVGYRIGKGEDLGIIEALKLMK